MRYIETAIPFLDIDESFTRIFPVSSDGRANASLLVLSNMNLQDYNQQVKNHEVLPGRALWVNNDLLAIYKYKYFHTPRPDILEKTFLSMKELLTYRGVKRIAMLPMGEPEGLPWEDTQKLLVDIFEDTDIDIAVCRST